MDRLTELAVFVQVADSGSYTATARAIGLTASAIGKTIVRLEAKLGVRLFQRNTRRIKLTPEGDRLLARCRVIMQEVAAVERDLAVAREAPSGRLRVSAPLVADSWNRVFLDFMTAFPALELDLAYTNRIIDLIEEGFEIVLRIGSLKDSRLRARRLGAFRLVLVASPDYLQRHGEPRNLDDLDHHACLRSRNASTCQLYPWPLGPDALQRSARLTTRLTVDHNAMLLMAALDGTGIACLPAFWARDHVTRGALRVLLPEETRNERDVSAVWVADRVVSPKVAAFVDYMAEHLPAALL